MEDVQLILKLFLILGTLSHWENNNATANNLNNEKLENINLDANYTFTANFTSCDIAIEVTLEQRNNIIIPNITEYSGDILYQWYANGQLVSSDSIIYNPADGVYKLYVTIGNCQVHSNLLVYEKNDYDLEIYPNPAENEFELIFLLSSRQDIEISIINNLGQEISKNKIDDFIGQYKEKVNVSSLSKGVYFVQLKTNNEIYNKKLILSK